MAVGKPVYQEPKPVEKNVEVEGFLTKPLISDTKVTVTVRMEPRYNHFPWGWCTYYVASRVEVPWRGNAIAWLENAKAMGYKTGIEPEIGAILVTSESWWGHVAYVESVAENHLTISEMNYAGFGKISSRTIAKSSSFIKGYIY